MGEINLCCDVSDDDDDDYYEDDTWMSVDSDCSTESRQDDHGPTSREEAHVEDGKSKSGQKSLEEREQDVSNHSDEAAQGEEVEEEEEEDIYRALLPDRDEHVLCNFALSCVYRETTNKSIAANSERPTTLEGTAPRMNNGWGQDQMEALNMLQMVVDLQLHIQPSY